LPTSIAPLPSHSTGNLRAFLSWIKLLSYFSQPALASPIYLNFEKSYPCVETINPFLRKDKKYD